jgi:hypothetical protein
MDVSGAFAFEHFGARGDLLSCSCRVMVRGVRCGRFGMLAILSPSSSAFDFTSNENASSCPQIS